MKQLFCFFLHLLGFGSSCSSHEDRTTNTISTSCTSDAEKIAFMENYYTPDFP